MIPDRYPVISVHARMRRAGTTTYVENEEPPYRTRRSVTPILVPAGPGGRLLMRVRAYNTTRYSAWRHAHRALLICFLEPALPLYTCTKLHTRYLQARETTYARHTIEILITTVRDLSIKSTARARVRSRVQATRDTCYVHENACYAASTN
jgi:hypothetical protein